jgi:hypothetical protein
MTSRPKICVSRVVSPAAESLDGFFTRGLAIMPCDAGAGGAALSVGRNNGLALTL